MKDHGGEFASCEQSWTNVNNCETIVKQMWKQCEQIWKNVKQMSTNVGKILKNVKTSEINVK